MGTNFYLKSAYQPTKHLCKFSSGWIPLFKEDYQYTSLKELIEYLTSPEVDYYIIDEYDRRYTLNRLLKKVYAHAYRNKGIRENNKCRLDRNKLIQWTQFEFS